MNGLVRLAMRMLVWAGLRIGVDHITSRNMNSAGNDAAARARAAQTGQRMRQAMRILRRFGRF